MARAGVVDNVELPAEYERLLLPSWTREGAERERRELAAQRRRLYVGIAGAAGWPIVAGALALYFHQTYEHAFSALHLWVGVVVLIVSAGAWSFTRWRKRLAGPRWYERGAGQGNKAT